MRKSGYSDISSGNEWKTRYETQIELNAQLERQMSFIHQRLEGLRGNPVGELAPWSLKAFILFKGKLISRVHSL